MKIRTYGRHGREGFKNLFRNGWMTLAAISGVAVTLLILGVSLIISVNIQNILFNIESELQFNAYVSDQVQMSQLPALTHDIASLQGIKQVKLVTKQQALSSMKKTLGANADLLNGLGNPLPNEFVVKVDDPKMITQLAAKVEGIHGIQKVQSGASFVPRLLSVLSIVRDTSVIFIIALLLMGMFLISNTIKITIFTRRREIEIMKLVGATDGFIRGPFFVEGTLMGIVGAFIPSIILNQVYFLIQKNILLFPPFSLMPDPIVMNKVLPILYAVGLLIGAWGGIVSMRKYLRV